MAFFVPMCIIFCDIQSRVQKLIIWTSEGKFPGNAVHVPTPKFEFFREFVPENPQFFFVICPHLVHEVFLEVNFIPVPEISGNVPEKPQYDQPKYTPIFGEYL